MCRQNFPKLWCRYEFIVHNRLRNFETVPEWIQQKICRKFSETDSRKLLLKTAPFRDWFFSFQHYEKIIVSQAVHHNPSGKYASRCWAKRKWLHILWQTIPEVRTNRVERKQRWKVRQPINEIHSFRCSIISILPVSFFKPHVWRVHCRM